MAGAKEKLKRIGSELKIGFEEGRNPSPAGQGPVANAINTVGFVGGAWAAVGDEFRRGFNYLGNAVRGAVRGKKK